MRENGKSGLYYLRYMTWYGLRENLLFLQRKDWSKRSNESCIILPYYVAFGSCFPEEACGLQV